ncbi:hypothetical protein E2C01_008812 [Portunus trituberculatus]|uniref:Uncharacterized protein n=1 Tax=Portunus trituberculatus TaxID=210409 RepID=A0A5B7D3X4_PORTR|nr:hypothetical protein [Portunus trituberculatus]
MQRRKNINDPHAPTSREEWERERERGGRWSPSHGRMDPMREGPRRMEDHARHDPYGPPRFPPRRPQQEFWEGDPRYPDRPPRDEYFRDDVGPRQRWDYYDDGRGNPYPPYDDPYYYDHYDRDRDRDRYPDQYGDRYEDRFRDPDPYRPRDRSPYPSPRPDEPYAPYPRDRWDPFSRGPPEEEREPPPSRPDQPAVVDYGHGSTMRGEQPR